MGGGMITARQHPKGFAYAYKRASETRQCIRGDSIEVGATYLILYRMKNGEITGKSLRFCHNHYSTCELCQRPVFKKGNGFFLRFDTDECAQKHFDRAEADIQERAWGGDY